MHREGSFRLPFFDISCSISPYSYSLYADFDVRERSFDCVKLVGQILLFITVNLGAALQLHARDHSSDSAYQKIKAEVLYNVWYLEKFNRYEPEFYEVEVELIAERTTILLSQLLEFPQSVGTDSLRSSTLKLVLSTNDTFRIRIYQFGYSCGGTHGWVDLAVMQWRSKSGLLHSYQLSGLIELSYTGIHKLKEDSTSAIYLVLGSDYDTPAYGYTSAMVFKFSGEYFFTNHPAFGSQFGISFCHSDVSYDQHAKTLTIEPYQLEICYSIIGPKPRAIVEADPGLDKMLSGYFEEKPLKLKWNGYRFSRI